MHKSWLGVTQCKPAGLKEISKGSFFKGVNETLHVAKGRISGGKSGGTFG